MRVKLFEESFPATPARHWANSTGPLGMLTPEKTSAPEEGPAFVVASEFGDAILRQVLLHKNKCL